MEVVKHQAKLKDENEWVDIPSARANEFKAAGHQVRELVPRPKLKLKLTESLRNEWDTRSIGGVIPALDAIDWRNARTIEVDAALADEIKADCLHQIDPKAVDATAAERAPYRALLRQIEAA